MNALSAARHLPYEQDFLDGASQTRTGDLYCLSRARANSRWGSACAGSADGSPEYELPASGPLAAAEFQVRACRTRMTNDPSALFDTTSIRRCQLGSTSVFTSLGPRSKGAFQ
jgi:hypothetical protein